MTKRQEALTDEEAAQLSRLIIATLKAQLDHRLASPDQPGPPIGSTIAGFRRTQ